MKTAQKRATVYLDQHLHRALRLKAVETERSVSDIINEAVRQSLAEDADDLAAIEERAHEPWLRFEDVVKDMKKRGLL
jgi:predicted transcriptional regulator